MTNPPGAPIRVNGWSLFMHPMFLAQVEGLLIQVEALRKKDPAGHGSRNPTKRLAAISKLVFEVIPRDPSAAEFRQGDSLGASHKHWFRAKFFQQYRLFFRYDARARVIIYAWVNDEDTKRAYGSRSDAYHVFKKMLGRGRPPDDWAALLAESTASGDRTSRLAGHLDTLSSKDMG